ncbi:MAG: DUF4124 domain-containing protein [Luteimonas sp.]
MRGILLAPALAVAVLLSLGMLANDVLAAPGVVIYRCTDASGALTIQNDVRCPKGSRQEKQVLASPPNAPAYVPPAKPKPVVAPRPAPVAPEPRANETPAVSTIADADRLPPPMLFRCNTFDNDSYLSDAGTPAPRCVRLNTTGINGNADIGAGEACQMVTDQCERVADGAICAAWIERRKQVEAAWKFGRGVDAEANRLEYERIDRLVRDSTCGK